MDLTIRDRAASLRPACDSPLLTAYSGQSTAGVFGPGRPPDRAIGIDAGRRVRGGVSYDQMMTPAW
jgi:hypothetical protein